jgi:hypothetical protein
VQHEVHPAVDVDVVGDVVLDELEVRMARQVRDVGDVAGEQVVDADDGIAAIEQRLGQVRPDEAGSAGDDDTRFHKGKQGRLTEMGLAPLSTRACGRTPSAPSAT